MEADLPPACGGQPRREPIEPRLGEQLEPGPEPTFAVEGEHVVHELLLGGAEPVHAVHEVELRHRGRRRSHDPPEAPQLDAGAGRQPALAEHDPGLLDPPGEVDGGEGGHARHAVSSGSRREGTSNPSRSSVAWPPTGRRGYALRGPGTGSR